jgi:hypothetical protein
MLQYIVADLLKAATVKLTQKAVAREWSHKQAYCKETHWQLEVSTSAQELQLKEASRQQ